MNEKLANLLWLFVKANIDRETEHGYAHEDYLQTVKDRFLHELDSYVDEKCSKNIRKRK